MLHLNTNAAYTVQFRVAEVLSNLYMHVSMPKICIYQYKITGKDVSNVMDLLYYLYYLYYGSQHTHVTCEVHSLETAKPIKKRSTYKYICCSCSITSFMHSTKLRCKYI
jgi:hypothetical protein